MCICVIVTLSNVYFNFCNYLWLGIGPVQLNKIRPSVSAFSPELLSHCWLSLWLTSSLSSLAGYWQWSVFSLQCLFSIFWYSALIFLNTRAEFFGRCPHFGKFLLTHWRTPPAPGWVTHQLNARHHAHPSRALPPRSQPAHHIYHTSMTRIGGTQIEP